MPRIHPWLPNEDFWEQHREFARKTLLEISSIIPTEVQSKALFTKIPENPIEPWSIEDFLLTILHLNTSLTKTFAGGIVCPHYVHPVVDAIISRGEFLTAYTPYQPEINQGALQALFEFQSMLAELYGVEVVNAGMYDGATALGEAAGLSFRVTRKKTILLPKTMLSRIKQVVKTYVYAFNGYALEYDPLAEDLSTLIENLPNANNISAIVVENPLGTGEVYRRLSEIVEISRSIKALTIAYYNPLLASVIKPPGDQGADIVVGEGQSLGLPMNMGGPLLGIIGVKSDIKLIRNMPGRIIGATKDSEGKRAYAMILQTREQHIRREKATSNITTNTALNAIAAGISVSLMGRKGIRSIALRTIENSNYLKERLRKIDKLNVLPSQLVFGNVAYKLTTNDKKVVKHAFNVIYREHGIVPFFPDDSALLSCATEVHDRDKIDKFVDLLGSIIGDLT